jgi:hypothetical protein
LELRWSLELDVWDLALLWSLKFGIGSFLPGLAAFKKFRCARCAKAFKVLRSFAAELLLFGSITRRQGPHPLGSIRCPAANRLLDFKRFNMAVVKEIIESFAMKTVRDRPPSTSSAGHDLVRGLISGAWSSGAHTK